MAKDNDVMSQAEADMRHKSVINRWERRIDENAARAHKARIAANKALADSLEDSRAKLAEEIIQARSEGREGLRRIKRTLEDEGYSFESLKNNDAGADD